MTKQISLTYAICTGFKPEIAAFIILLSIALLVSGCASVAPVENTVEAPVISTELPAGPDETLFADLDQEILRSHPYILAVQISNNGRNVFERHYDGQGENTRRLTASVTKSFLSTLVGIAWDKGYISDLDAKIINFFPEYRSGVMDARVNDITIRHLLTMTSGVKYDVTTDIMRWVGEADAMQYLFVTPFESDPGFSFRYHDPGVHILGGLIEKTSGMALADFAATYLFDPLGITDYHWETDNNGMPFGSHGMWLSVEDMSKLGQLYLNKGLWNGDRIVSEQWIEMATKPQAAGGFPYAARYGLLWWIEKIGTHDAYFAAGYGGQFVMVVPNLSLVVAIQSDIQTHRDKSIRDLVTRYVIPVLTQE